jgi:hypothetical protein
MDLSEICRLLAAHAERKERRTVGRPPERPSEWTPQRVTQPETGLQFSPAGAWAFIAETLRAGHPVQVITLDQPIGLPAYVMEVPLDAKKPPLYVKVELGADCIIGRSFHYSYR